MTAPSVFLVGPAGFIGKEITPTFLDALRSKQISSLTLLTRDPKSSRYDGARSQGAKVELASFEDKPALVRTLRGGDVVVSCMGTQGDYKKNKHVLMEACTPVPSPVSTRFTHCND